ncbi:hypothetical protein TH19_22255 [Thalassospira profundimaris]|uniref:Uncharacterized protein n=1 Tax=Thalassospira profundimaris TaxID=502049 RepID=A0A367VYN1_9PROT|nr:hypothetical protein TH19_22255 [Thalassospira profundimaris]
MWAYLLVGAVVDRVGRMGKMPGQGRFNGKCRNVNGIIGDVCPLCAGEMAPVYAVFDGKGAEKPNPPGLLRGGLGARVRT